MKLSAPLLLSAALSMSACSRAPEPATETPAPRSFVVTWAEDAPHEFEVSIVTKTSLGADSAASPALTLLLPTRVELRGTRAQLRGLVSFRDPRFTAEGGIAPDSMSPLLEDLARPFGFEMQEGLLDAVFDPPASSAGAIGYRRQVLALLQSHPTEQPNSALEWDPAGLASVEFSPSPEDEALWRWKKLGFESFTQQTSGPLPPSKNEVKPQIVESSGFVRLKRGALQELERLEKLRVPLSSSAALVNETRSLLRRVEPTAAPPSDWASVFEESRRTPAGHLPPIAAGLAAAARRGDASFAETLEQVKALSRAREAESAASTSERSAVFHSLVEHLRDDPKNVSEVARAARQPDADANPLLDALAMASTSSSLEALGALAFDKKLPAARRKRAADSLIRTQSPTAEAFALTLRMLSDPELREHGLLGLGSFVRHLKRLGSPRLVDEGTATLDKELRSSRSDSDRSAILLAIANSGASTLFEQVVPFQASANRAVREAAIQAIRLMERPEVEPRLVELLGASDVGTVEAALHALRRREAREAGTVDVVIRLARQHASTQVRKEALLVLREWRKSWSQAEETLRQVAQSDSEARLRQVAQESLSR